MSLDLEKIFAYIIFGFLSILVTFSMYSWSDKVHKNREKKEKCVNAGHVYVDKQCLNVEVIEL